MESRNFLAKAEDNATVLMQNSYPGRGIVVGMDETKECLIHAYWLTGRSPKSRNRVFVRENGAVKTVLADSSLSTEDTSLIIYKAMAERRYNGVYVKNNKLLDSVHAVSNGRQTKDALSKHSLEKSIENWEYEPDDPNFTPRITAVSKIFFAKKYETEIAIFKKSPEGKECVRLFFKPELNAGFGHCLTTYKGDGNPLPAFDGNPYILPLVGGIDKVASTLWNFLNKDNRISLVVKFINLSTKESEYKIINRYEAVS